MRQSSGGIDVGHGRGDSALGHHRVSFAEQRFADDANRRALGQRFDGRAQAGAARADDQYIVFVGLKFRRILVHRQNSLTSWMAPLATMRMYRSVRPTQNRLIQANSMWRSLSTVDHPPRGMPRLAEGSARKAIQLSAGEVAQRMAGKGVDGEQD